MANILPIATGLFEGVGNVLSTWQTNRANRELAEYSFEQQKQMIREQNEYNSPKAQLERYKEAGLNPALIYGNGVSSAGNQSAIARYDAPTMQAPNVNLGILDALRFGLEAKKTEAEINNINAQTDRYREDVTSAMMKNAWDAFLLGKPMDGWNFDNTPKLNEWNVSLSSKQIMNTLREEQTYFQQMKNKEQDFFLQKLLPLTLKLKELEVQGASYENAMKAIDTEIWRDKRIAEMSSSPFRIIGRIGDGILNNGTPTSEAFKDFLTHPFSLKYNPTYKSAKDAYHWVKGKLKKWKK